jgi:hypothetical protein
MKLNLRNGSLMELDAELREQKERQADLIVPARDLWSRNGSVLVRDAGVPVFSDTGMTTQHLNLSPSPVFDEGLSGKLSLPRAYVRTLRESGRTDILDNMINRTLHGNEDIPSAVADDRKFMVRTFTAAKENGVGYARALLSNSYKPIDNWDVLNAVIMGMTAAGLDAHVVRQADLTDRRMYVKIVVPEVQALAPNLLRNYVSPYSRNRGADNPTVFAGLVIKNSETGGSAFTITPELTVEICTNGMTITQDAIRKTHLGSKLEEDGLIKVSNETQQANLALITAQTKDAVNTFLDVDYMKNVIDRIERQAGTELVAPQDVVQSIVKRAAFTAADADGIMDAFIKGADVTRGGMFNAITAYSQRVEDADHAYEMDADALAAVGMVGVSGRSA